MPFASQIASFSIAALLGVAAQVPDDAPESAADAVKAQWEEELGARFRELAAEPEADFIAAWDAELARWLAALDAAEAQDGVSAEAERVSIRYEWAFGRLFYPEWHAGLTEQPGFEPSDSYDAYLDQLEFDRPDFLAVAEYGQFLSQIRNIDADAIFETRAETLSGGAQYLQAKLQASERFENPEIRCFLEADALSYWLENFDADGLSTEVQDHAARCPGERADDLVALFERERAERDGHAIEIFKTVDGHELELHIYTPDDWTPGDPLRPAVMWSHGGGWFFGSWSWCGPCQFFKDRGMVVAQVEYRLRGRHGTDAPDALSDVTDAIAWLRENGARYGADPARIAASGFSAGAHLSLAAAVLEPEGSPSRPDLALSFSGCTDMTDDAYMTRMAGGGAAARAISPLHALSGPTPPVFIVNAENDGDCAFQSAVEFVDAARAEGSEVDFQEVPDEGHFFLRNPDLADQTRERVYAFLDAHSF